MVVLAGTVGIVVTAEAGLVGGDVCKMLIVKQLTPRFRDSTVTSLSISSHSAPVSRCHTPV